MIVFNFWFMTCGAFARGKPVGSRWGHFSTWKIIKEHYRFVVSICYLMWSIAGDNNKGGIMISVDFDGFVSNLNHRSTSKDDIVLCFFMPMKWQKTSFVNSNESLFKHTGKFAIFNLFQGIGNRFLSILV